MLIYSPTKYVLKIYFCPYFEPYIFLVMTNQKQHSFIEIIKFLVVGVSNTAVDFVVLNFLLLVWGASGHGGTFATFKTISFSVAVINSYVLNKYWVFKGETKYSHFHESILFFTVSCIGLLLNVCVSTGAFILIKNSLLIDPHIGANIAALTGSLFVFLWNFAGYKLVVFRK